VQLLNGADHKQLEATLLEAISFSEKDPEGSIEYRQEHRRGYLMELAAAAVVREMEQQYLLIEQEVGSVYASGDPIPHALVLCGPGNNGGDGWAIAWRLHVAGRSVEVWSFARCSELVGDAKLMSDHAINAGVQFLEITDDDIFREAERNIPSSVRGTHKQKELLIVIDALLGAGINRPIEGLLARGVEFCRSIKGTTSSPGGDYDGMEMPYVIAVDIPSGLSADSAALPDIAVAANLTVAMLSVRVPHVVRPATRAVGKLVAYDLNADILVGLDYENSDFENSDFENRTSLDSFGAETKSSRPHPYPYHTTERWWYMHKGQAGRVVIVAGSAGKTGAAQLAGLAALRSGTGLVTLAVPAECVSRVTHVPDYMTLALPSQNGMVTGEGADDIFALRPDVIALGPGLGLGDGPRRLIEQVLAKAKDAGIPVVLDADGLSVFAGERNQALQGYGSSLVITPHPGELSRLTGLSTAAIQADRVTVARQCARDWNITVILKGFQTVIAFPDNPGEGESQFDNLKISINTTGNPGLATGGTGDVLTGIIAGFLARDDFPTNDDNSADPVASLRASVFLHGYVGDLAAAEVGQISLIASDLIRLLPRGIMELAAGKPSVAPPYSTDNIWQDSTKLQRMTGQ